MLVERCARIPGYGGLLPDTGHAVDVQRARLLLADASHAPGDLRVTVSSWRAEEADTRAIVNYLIAIGIRAGGAEFLSLERGRAAWRDADIDIGVHLFRGQGPDPDMILYQYFYTGAPMNYGRYVNPELDVLVDRMSRTTDPELRRRRAWGALEIALRDRAGIIVAHSVSLPVLNGRVRGLISAPGYLAAFGPFNRHDPPGSQRLRDPP